ncbi:hypothetical protein ACWD6R_31140 [Streptomyces sp. NPDC005151]
MPLRRDGDDVRALRSGELDLQVAQGSAAPVTRTRWPGLRLPVRRVRRAVVPAMGSAAAAVSTSGGSVPIRLVDTATDSAQPASSANATTWVPATGPDPSAAARVTTPATF